MTIENNIYRGNVVEVTPLGIYVEVPRLAVGMVFGPCESHDGTELAVGDKVSVAQVEGYAEDIVILGKVVLDPETHLPPHTHPLPAHTHPASDINSGEFTNERIGSKAITERNLMVGDLTNFAGARDFKDWQFDAGVTKERQTAGLPLGVKEADVLRFSTTGSQHAYGPRFDIRADDRFTQVVYVKVPTTVTAGNIDVRLRYLDADGITSPPYFSVGTIGVSKFDGTWQKVEFTATVPTGKSYARIEVVGYGLTAGQTYEMTLPVSRRGVGAGEFGNIPISAIPTGTSGSTVALGNHLHDDRYYTESETNSLLNRKVEVTSGATAATGREFRDLLVWGQSVNDAPGMIVIETPITFGNYMTDITITGYDYLWGKASIDLRIGFYAYSTGPSFPVYSVTDTSTADIGNVQVARNTATGTVAIIIHNTRPAGWRYPRLQVQRMNVSQTWAPDSFGSGWSANIKTSLTGYDVINNPQSKLTMTDASHVLTGTFPVARLPVGTSAAHVAAGDHNHDDKYEPKTVDTGWLSLAGMNGWVANSGTAMRFVFGYVMLRGSFVVPSPSTGAICNLGYFPPSTMARRYVVASTHTSGMTQLLVGTNGNITVSASAPPAGGTVYIDGIIF